MTAHSQHLSQVHAHRTPRAREALRAGWIAFVLAALLAFSWQSFLAQTHQHIRPVANARAPIATQLAKDTRAPADPADACPICRVLAQAGHYLLPEAPTWQPRAVVLPPVAVVATLALAHSARSHRWQSRAPPLLRA